MIIVLEGIDNSGKTFQSMELKRILVAMGYSVDVKKDNIEKLLAVGRRYVKDNDVPEFFGEFIEGASRYLGYSHIPPNADIVIIDRFIHTVYSHSIGNLSGVTDLPSAQLICDLIIYLDITPEESLRRSRLLGEPIPLGLEKQGEIRSKFMEMVDRGILVKVDGMQPYEMVTEEMMGLIMDRLG